MRLAALFFLLTVPAWGQLTVSMPGPGPIQAAASGGTLIAGASAQTGVDFNGLLPVGILFVTPPTGTYTVGTDCQIWVGNTTSSTIDCGLYSVSSNAPNSLVCHVTRTGTWTASAFNSVGIPSGCGTLAANTQYVLATINSNNSVGEEGTLTGSCPGSFDGSGNSLSSMFGTSQGSAVLPGSWGTNHTTGNCWAQYITLTCVSACGARTDRYMFSGFESTTNGVSPTSTALGNSAVTGVGGVSWTTLSARFTGCTSGQLHNLLNNFTVNGQTQNGSGTLGVCYTATNSGAADDGPVTYFPTGQMTISWWFSTTIPQNDNNTHFYSLGTMFSVDTTSVKCNPQIIPTGSALTMVMETNAGDSSGSITFGTNTTYKIQQNWSTNGTNTVCSLAMYDTSGVQVGSTISKTVAAANQFTNTWQLGISGAETRTVGVVIIWDDIIGDITGTFPMPN